MTRHFFRFTMVNASLTELMTEDDEDARKVVDFRWATGGGPYFTPWLTPFTVDKYGDQIPDDRKLRRVNFMHVTAVEYEKRER